MTKQLKKNTLQKEISYLEGLIQKGGPDIKDYEDLDKWYERVWNIYGKDKLTINKIRNAFGDVYTNIKGIFGLNYVSPHGYKGDYEIIDRIYQKYSSSAPSLKKWDEYFQNHINAPQAVRNRKTYFKKLLTQKSSINQPITVLNVASGPCRDLKEFFEESLEAKIYFDCVELDKNAIAYAQKLTQHHPNIRFIHKNIFRFATDKQYDLVWSAGLFDYFEDKIFVRILQRLLQNIKKGGELVIGNFHPRNPTRSVMEVATWHLHHRTEQQLTKLALAAGVDDERRIRIEQEAEGINLFMRIQCI